MKKNRKQEDWDSFYEDEESLKMLELVNENGDKETSNKSRYNKKTTLEKIEIVFMVISVIFILIALFSIYNKLNKDALDSCQKIGNSYDYCINHI